MKSILMAGVGLLTLSWSACCHAHGSPILVDAIAGQLAISGGVVDERGWANWVFAEQDEEGNLTPAPGSVLLTRLPGFEISGMTAGQQISLEPLSRPDFTDPAAPPRWLWYWDPSSQLVVDVPQDPTLEIASEEISEPSVELTQSTASARTSLLMATLESSDIGQHRHFLAYLLDDNPSASLGAYGFFARLISPDFGASEPILVALNHGLDAASFQAGALRINAAARLPGDYDDDDDADGGDLLAWQQALGSTTLLAADGSVNDVVDAADLTVWRDNFGRVAPAATTAAVAVPEPNVGTLLTLGSAVLPVMRRQRLPARMAGLSKMGFRG